MTVPMAVTEPGQLISCLPAVLPAAYLLFLCFAIFAPGFCDGGACLPRVLLLWVAEVSLSLLCEVFYHAGPAGLSLFLLVWLSLEDARSKTLPNFCSFPLLLTSLCGTILPRLLAGDSSVFGSLLRMCGVFLIFALLSLLSRGALGFGDVKLLTPFALLLGLWDFLGLLLTSLVFLSVAGLFLIIMRMARHQPIKGVSLPFAPFFTLAFLVVYMGG